jgi:hypothetical protein
MPFGRCQLSVTIPTGSLTAATASMPAAIASMRSELRVRRSRKAAVMPPLRASAMSSAFAADIAVCSARIAAAIAANALFFWAVEASASVRAAWRARMPISRIVCARSGDVATVFSGAAMMLFS